MSVGRAEIQSTGDHVGFAKGIRYILSSQDIVLVVESLSRV